MDERKSQTPLRDEGGPIGSETVLPAAIDPRRPHRIADDATIASSQQADDIRRHIHDTITFCGDPATVREGFAIALDVLEAYADSLPSDALMPAIDHTPKGD